jgi:excisionase family DNA binding protein
MTYHNKKPIEIPIATSLPRLLNIREAAQVLGVSVRTVHTLKKLRQLTYIKVRGSIRFDPAHLDEYLQKRIVRAA